MKTKETPSLNILIYELCRYGESVSLFDPLDRTYIINRLLALFGEDAVLLTIFGISLKVYMLNKVIATGLVMVWNYFTKRWLLKGNK